MRTDLDEKTLKEIAVSKNKNYGIEPIPRITQAPSYMIRPWWLNSPGTLSYSALPNEDTAMEIYCQFFLFYNKECQKSLFNSLMREIIHAESAMFNIYDNSKSSVVYASNTVDAIFTRWRDNITALIGEDESRRYAFWLDTFAIYQDGAPVNTYDASAAMERLSQGAAIHDFLTNHPETQNQFNKHILGLSHHALKNKLQVAKVVTETVGNKS